MPLPCVAIGPALDLQLIDDQSRMTNVAFLFILVHCKLKFWRFEDARIWVFDENFWWAGHQRFSVYKRCHLLRHEKGDISACFWDVTRSYVTDDTSKTGMPCKPRIAGWLMTGPFRFMFIYEVNSVTTATASLVPGIVRFTAHGVRRDADSSCSMRSHFAQMEADQIKILRK